MTLYEIKVRKKAKIRNWYNQAPHLTQDTTRERDKNTIKHHISNTKLQTPIQLWYALLCVLLVFAIILRKREPVALLFMFFWCLVAVNVMWLVLMVPWVGLQCVIVVCPALTHLFFHTLVVFSFKKASEYDQEMPQSHTDNKSQARVPWINSTLIYLGNPLPIPNVWFKTNIGIEYKAWDPWRKSTLIYLGNSLPIPNLWFKANIGIE